MPFRIRPYDTDNGSEFINRDLIAWLQERDIEQTRSRPYRKNDQATVESRNNHIVRRHAFHYRYTVDELGLLNELWELVRIKANLFTPSKKPVGRACTRDGGRGASTTSRAPRGRGSRSSTRRTGPREDRDSSCPANARRSNGSSPRRTRGARPAHPRHTGPTRSPGRATHCTARQTRRPGHGILEQDARPDRGRRTGRRRNPAGRRGLGFRAHPR